MDVAIILQALGIIWSVVVLIAGAVVVGTRRGLRETTTRMSAEQTALIALLQQRVEALVEENKRQAVTMGQLQVTNVDLQKQLDNIRHELEMEKRITARIVGSATVIQPEAVKDAG